MAKINNNNFIVIHGWMINELNLTGNELLVFAIIYGFSQDGESKYTGSRGYLAEWCNTSLPTVDAALKKLIEKGLIKKETENINGTQIVKYSFIGYKEFLHPYKESLHNNIDNNIEYSSVINNKEEEESEDQEEPIEEKDVVEYFKNKMWLNRVKERPLIQRMQMLRECEVDPRWKEVGPEEEQELREYILKIIGGKRS